MSMIDKTKAAASPDELAKAGREAPVALTESELEDASGGIAIIANTSFPKVEIFPKVELSGNKLSGNKFSKP